MIHLLYIVYCIGHFAYTGNAVITGDRALAFVGIGAFEIMVELILFAIITMSGDNK